MEEVALEEEAEFSLEEIEETENALEAWPSRRMRDIERSISQVRGRENPAHT